MGSVCLGNWTAEASLAIWFPILKFFQNMNVLWNRTVRLSMLVVLHMVILATFTIKLRTLGSFIPENQFFYPYFSSNSIKLNLPGLTMPHIKMPLFVAKKFCAIPLFDRH